MEEKKEEMKEKNNEEKLSVEESVHMGIAIESILMGLQRRCIPAQRRSVQVSPHRPSLVESAWCEVSAPGLSPPEPTIGAARLRVVEDFLLRGSLICGPNAMRRQRARDQERKKGTALFGPAASFSSSRVGNIMAEHVRKVNSAGPSVLIVLWTRRQAARLPFQDPDVHRFRTCGHWNACYPAPLAGTASE
ncbi:hypothetical protein MRX96_027138 [Rhipicephalus microplus]